VGAVAFKMAESFSKEISARNFGAGIGGGKRFRADGFGDADCF
jgi:hypothetical protein